MINKSILNSVKIDPIIVNINGRIILTSIDYHDNYIDINVLDYSNIYNNPHILTKQLYIYKKYINKKYLYNIILNIIGMIFVSYKDLYVTPHSIINNINITKIILQTLSVLNLKLTDATELYTIIYNYVNNIDSPLSNIINTYKSILDEDSDNTNSAVEVKTLFENDVISLLLNHKSNNFSITNILLERAIRTRNSMEIDTIKELFNTNEKVSDTVILLNYLIKPVKLSKIVKENIHKYINNNDLINFIFHEEANTVYQNLLNFVLGKDDSEINSLEDILSILHKDLYPTPMVEPAIVTLLNLTKEKRTELTGLIKNLYNTDSEITDRNLYAFIYKILRKNITKDIDFNNLEEVERTYKTIVDNNSNRDIQLDFNIQRYIRVRSSNTHINVIDNPTEDNIRTLFDTRFIDYDYSIISDYNMSINTILYKPQIIYNNDLAMIIYHNDIVYNILVIIDDGENTEYLINNQYSVNYILDLCLKHDVPVTKNILASINENIKTTRRKNNE